MKNEMKLVAKIYSYEYVFLCRLPDIDHRWELKPSHSEVPAVTKELADKLASAFSQFEALNAVAESASKLPWNKLQKADAGSVNDALCDLQNALATLNAIKAEMV